MTRYARVLTLRPSDVTRAHVNKLKEVGISEPEIIDIVQVIGYFAYVRRVVAGLGVTLACDGMRFSEGRAASNDATGRVAKSKL